MIFNFIYMFVSLPMPSSSYRVITVSMSAPGHNCMKCVICVRTSKYTQKKQVVFIQTNCHLNFGFQALPLKRFRSQLIQITYTVIAIACRFDLYCCRHFGIPIAHNIAFECCDRIASQCEKNNPLKLHVSSVDSTPHKLYISEIAI